MSLEIALNENTLAIRQLIAALCAVSALQPMPAPIAAQAQLEEAPAPAKAKRARAKAAPAPPAEEPVPLDTAPATVGPVLTYDDVKGPFLTDLVAKHGRAAGAQLLRDFGVPEGGKLSDIPADRWADVLAAIRERCA